MQAAIENAPWLHILSGIAAVVAILAVSWVLASWSVNRETRRRDSAEAAAGTIRLQILATRQEFKDKYMPVALRELLDEAWQAYSSLSGRSYYISNAAALKHLEDEAAEMVERIKQQAEAKPTAADFAADAAVLTEELAQAEQAAAEALEQAKRAFDQEVESANHTLNYERERIAKARKQLQELEQASTS